MRHRKAGVKLNMTSSHKQAMFRNMVTSLFKYDRIRTTNAKAKELRRLADHMVTLAKRGDLHARRQAMSVIREKDVVHKLFEEASERFGTASGGYTRIIKLGHRPGDAAPVSLIELITTESRDKKKPAKKTKPTAAPKKVTEKAVEKEAAEEKAPVAEAEAEAAAVDSGDADSVSDAPEEAAAAEESAEPQEAAAEKKAEEAQPDEVAPESDDKEAEESKDKSE
ncbi:MAG: 50S ribosomal protein L17 [Thermodesulfobacteriota bacterium]